MSSQPLRASGRAFVPPGVRGHQARLQGLPGTCPKRQMRANKVGCREAPPAPSPDVSAQGHDHALTPAISLTHIGTRVCPHSRPAKHMGRWPLSRTVQCGWVARLRATWQWTPRGDSSPAGALITDAPWGKLSSLEVCNPSLLGQGGHQRVRASTGEGISPV